MKSLRTIQILFKIAKIVAIILFAFAIAGAVFSALGIALIHVVKDVNVEPGKTLAMFLLEKGVSINAVYVYCAIGILACIVGAFLYFCFYRYCKEVVDDATPFTRKSVKDMRRFAVINIIANVALAVLAVIAAVIAKACDPNIGTLKVGNWISLSFAICLLILSVFVEYPVEAQEKGVLVDKTKEDETLKPEDYVE